MNNWLKTTVGFLVSLTVVLIANGARATTDDQVIAELQAQLAALSARLEQLESRQRIPESRYEVPAIAPLAAASTTWADRIRMKGDFRYRHEVIDAEFNGKRRQRQRIRARPAFEADITGNLKVGFGLASGGDDPVSSNQTLGDAFSTKGLNMDLAYFDWSTSIDGLNVRGGKFKNPLHRTGGAGLLWDSDLRPEGISAVFERGGLNITALGLWANESSQSRDELVLGGQAFWSSNFGTEANLRIGAGYYDYSGVKGQEVPFDGNARGNSVDDANRYLVGYEELELSAEFAFNIADRGATIFANYVNNLEADVFDTGWVIGGAMEFNRGHNPWRLSYAYQDLEADAVFAIFTDSDFIGGGTDGKGHIIRGSYAVARNVSLRGTLFINQRGGNNGIAEDYNRLMLDLQLKY
ncbi:MAG: putative porin [Pseudomonadales bacterium]